MGMKPTDDQFSPEEAAHRRDEVVRRMANTPPQPNVKSPNRQSKKKKPTASDRAAQKSDRDTDDTEA